MCKELATKAKMGCAERKCQVSERLLVEFLEDQSWDGNNLIFSLITQTKSRRLSMEFATDKVGKHCQYRGGWKYQRNWMTLRNAVREMG